MYNNMAWPTDIHTRFNSALVDFSLTGFLQIFHSPSAWKMNHLVLICKWWNLPHYTFHAFSFVSVIRGHFHHLVYFPTRRFHNTNDFTCFQVLFRFIYSAVLSCYTCSVTKCHPAMTQGSHKQSRVHLVIWQDWLSMRFHHLKKKKEKLFRQIKFNEQLCWLELGPAPPGSCRGDHLQPTWALSKPQICPAPPSGAIHS